MKRLCSTLFPLFVLLLTVQPIFAQETFSFQGRLTGPDGTPVNDDTYTVRFQLFDTPTGGSPRWEESHTVTTKDGVFSTLLGSETVLDHDAFETMPYLQLTADGVAMEPRVSLTAVPYAMKSYRLDEAALVAGQNVTITQRADGALQIGSTGGSGSGLSSVATDATIAGNGTLSSPLGLADGSVTGEKLANNALVAGTNVDIVRRGNGSLEISAMGGGGLTQIASDATLAGDGTVGSPLQVADGAVTGEKLADDALVAGSNVTITRQAGGALEVASAGGGLAQVTSDETLTGDGTAGSPLQIAAPLMLAGAEIDGIIRGQYGDNLVGYLGGALGGVYGVNNGNGAIGRLGSGAGVVGTADPTLGVLGAFEYGVYGRFDSGNRGYLGRSDYAVYGLGSGHQGYIGGSDFALYARHASGNWGALGTSGFAGAFTGDVVVLGNLAKSSGSFKIDHPLDPANKYLSHSFVESPDMKNVYDGNVTTDEDGEAVVTLPGYFEMLNRDFRYQLTVIGQFAQAIIAEEIQGNQFVIRTDQPNVKVSWQVTGIRQDAWAEEHRIVVEEDKSAEERGFYLHPMLFGQPPQRSVMWARNPKAMLAIQQMPARLEAEDQRMATEQARIEAEVARIRARRQDR